MPFRSREIIQGWVNEFAKLGYPVSDVVRVIPHGVDPGDDTGLVTVRFANASTNAYLRPTNDAGDHRWLVAFEAREEQFELDSVGVAGLSAELAMTATLVAFLEAKSESLMRQRHTT